MPPRLETWQNDHHHVPQLDDSGAQPKDAIASSPHVLVAVLAAISTLVMLKLIFFCTDGWCWRRRRREQGHSLSQSGSAKAQSTTTVERDALPLSSLGDGNSNDEVLTSADANAEQASAGGLHDATFLSHMTTTSSVTTASTLAAPYVVAGPQQQQQHASSGEGYSVQRLSLSSEQRSSSHVSHEALDLAGDTSSSVHHSSPPSKLQSPVVDDSALVTSASVDGPALDLAASLPGPSARTTKSEPGALDTLHSPMASGSFMCDFPRRFEPVVRSSSTEPLESPSPIATAASPVSRSKSFQVKSSAPRVVPRFGSKKQRPTLSLSLNPLSDETETQESKDLKALEKVSCPRTKEELLAVDAITSKDALNEEFWNIPMHTAESAVACSGPKNRYATIFPTRSTRVLLPVIDNDSNSSYINANFISVSMACTQC
eukprot:scpid66158/ scgid4876/ 